MALPNKEELELLKTLREKVADILTEEQINDDMFLVRWLRARELNVEKAAEMLEAAVKWRKENGLDEEMIRKPMDPFYIENYPTWTDGQDKEGRAINCVAIGKWDVRKAVKAGKSEEFISYLTECYEGLRKAIEKSAKLRPPQEGNPPITQCRVIFDWDGFAWSQMFSLQTIQNFLQLGAIYEAYYPEILYNCYFINSPALISMVVKLLTPVLAPKTMDKITIFGTNRLEWEKAILEVIDADQIRPQFGGTKENDLNPFLEQVQQK